MLSTGFYLQRLRGKRLGRRQSRAGMGEGRYLSVFLFGLSQLATYSAKALLLKALLLRKTLLHALPGYGFSRIAPPMREKGRRPQFGYPARQGTARMSHIWAMGS